MDKEIERLNSVELENQELIKTINQLQKSLTNCIKTDKENVSIAEKKIDKIQEDNQNLNLMIQEFESLYKKTSAEMKITKEQLQ